MLAAILLFGCAGMTTIPRAVEAAKADSMIKMNWNNPELVVIDVRSAEEYDERHLPGAVNIDMQSRSFRRDIRTLDRNKTYILYCRAGNRSSTALDIMREEGFAKAALIIGGINVWIREGFRTVSSADEEE